MPSLLPRLRRVGVAALLTAFLPAPIASASVHAANVGQTVTFSVTVSGAAPFNYQWYKDGAPIRGATGATHVVASVTAAAAGSYAVAVANVAGSATSEDMLLSVNTPGDGPSIAVEPSAVSVVVGGRASFAVVASGPGPLTYQWRKNGVSIAGATSATHVLDGVQAADAAAYSVVVKGGGASVVSADARLTVVGAASRPAGGNGTKLINLSSRTQVGSGSDVSISGFVVSGTGAKTLLIRGIGPALAGYGVAEAMANPTLTVHAGNAVVATNEGWKSAEADRVRTEAQRLGAFALPEHGRDCAVLAGFAPGIYTVHLKDRNGAPGVGLIEIYDADAGGGSRLINLSVRAFVGREANRLITGLVVAGTTPKTMLVRAVGPGLAAYGVDGVLARPRVALFAGQTEIASNTGWTSAGGRDALIRAAAEVGAFPLDPARADSAMLLTLDPGVYTVQVTGADGGTGTALVESYTVD